MKKTVQYYLLLVLAFGMLACQDDESTPGTGEIQFALEDGLLDHSGRTATLPEGASLLISIEDAAGNAVFTLKKIDLISFGGQYTSAPLKLENKDYNLTDFILVDENNAVIYATPRSGSPFARLVNKPLPVPFTVATGKSTTIPTQVVRADESTPEDFGYATFPISIAAFPEFAVSVFAFKNGALSLTSAQACLLHEGDTIYKKYLGAKVSDIIFKGEPGNTYTFVLIKPGYGKYTKTFVLEELREELDNTPLEIILAPAITMKITPSAEGLYSFFMSGIAGKKVVIDWGDGTTENVTLSTFIPEEFGSYEFYHSPPDAKSYFVSITGDLDAIQELGYSWTGSSFDLSFQHATGLIRFGFYFNYAVEHLDFTANQQLSILAVGYASVNSINISANQKLKQITLEELPLSTAAVDAIVDDIYNNAVIGNIQGSLTMVRYDSDLGEDVMLGPPSPEAVEKLYILRDEYFWSIAPGF
jgi:hypothetical protein